MSMKRRFSHEIYFLECKWFKGLFDKSFQQIPEFFFQQIDADIFEIYFLECKGNQTADQGQVEMVLRDTANIE